jgi:hypothetical protein
MPWPSRRPLEGYVPEAVAQILPERNRAGGQEPAAERIDETPGAADGALAGPPARLARPLLGRRAMHGLAGELTLNYGPEAPSAGRDGAVFTGDGAT